MIRSDPKMPLLEPVFTAARGAFKLYQGDCLDILPQLPGESVDLIYADPPYFLSNDGITCHAGKMVSVNKGRWDKSRGFEADHAFNIAWLSECRRLLKPTGSIFVSGTAHNIFSIGFAMQKLGYKILNDIAWVKPNPPPNLSCRYFTHSQEWILWAKPHQKAKHKFNYELMRQLNGGKQMKSVWTIPPPERWEKQFGKHPAQKPVALVERIIACATDEGAVVLDPFQGSGTSGVACARLNRNYLGIEIENLYAALSTLRVSDQVYKSARCMGAMR